MGQSGQPGQGPPPGMMPNMPGVPMPGAPGMHPPPPRMPGAQGPVRMTPAMRQEYDMYVQNMIRQRGPGGMPQGQRMPGPRPQMIPGPGAAQPRMAIGVCAICGNAW